MGFSCRTGELESFSRKEAAYHSKPPDKGAEGLNAPNIVTGRVA